jgi:hypothetical protein
MIELHPIYDGGSAGYVLVMSVVGQVMSSHSRGCTFRLPEPN